MSYKTLQRAEEIVDAAEREPQKYGDLLKEMESKHHGLNGVSGKLKVRQEMERLQDRGCSRVKPSKGVSNVIWFRYKVSR